MLVSPAFGRLLAAILVAVAVTGCGNLVDRHYGPAETSATEAYQLEGRYIYLATAVNAYVSHPEAKPGVADALCTLDSTAFQSLTTVTDTLLGSGDKMMAALQTGGVALRNLSLSVLDDFSLTATVEDVGKRTVVLATIATQSLTRMRVFRKTFLEPNLKAFASTSTDPSPEDFRVLRSRSSDLHADIQAACG